MIEFTFPRRKLSIVFSTTFADLFVLAAHDTIPNISAPTMIGGHKSRLIAYQKIYESA